jgi:hypothetical protein
MQTNVKQLHHFQQQSHFLYQGQPITMLFLPLFTVKSNGLSDKSSALHISLYQVAQRLCI